MRNDVRKEKENSPRGNLKIKYHRQLESWLRKGHMKREVNLFYIYDSENTSNPKQVIPKIQQILSSFRKDEKVNLIINGRY